MYYAWVCEGGLAGLMCRLCVGVCVGSNGGKVIGVACDHRRDEQVKALIDTIQEQHGRLHLLVNNAFQVTPHPLDIRITHYQGKQASDFLVARMASLTDCILFCISPACCCLS